MRLRHPAGVGPDVSTPMTTGLAQTRSPTQGWRDRPCWRVLEIGFASGHEFLAVWQAWREDPQRPRLLHHVVIEPDPLAFQVWLETGAVAHYERTGSIAQQLAARCWGLVPGFHRFAFDNGHVLLTVCIGAIGAMLRAQRFDADAIRLNDRAARDWLLHDAHAIKALARCCRRGTWLGARRSTLQQAGCDALHASGFVEAPLPAIAQPRMPAPTTVSPADGFSAIYDPAWTPRRRSQAESLSSQSISGMPDGTTSVLVIGAGIAGAAVAASLARRGLQVRVLDAEAGPACGASSLPAGLLAPHVSADDCIRSRLSRAGLRATIEFARHRLVSGQDWQLSGVLERRIDAARVLAGRTDLAARDWSALASTAQRAAAGLDEAMPAIWHAHAGWARPGALVQALLDDPNIVFQGRTGVHALRSCTKGWQALRADGSVAARAPLVVVAAGHASAALIAASGGAGIHVLPLQPVRGQLSLVVFRPSTGDAGGASHRPPVQPPFPLNGAGSLLPDLAMGDGVRASVFGATYRSGIAEADVRADEHQENFERLRALSPAAADALNFRTPDAEVQGWAGVRAVAADRLPMVGPVPLGTCAAAESPTQPPPNPIWVCTAMGSRGLSQALCCAELLAARLFGEPLAMEPALAKALDVRRYLRS